MDDGTFDVVRPPVLLLLACLLCVAAAAAGAFAPTTWAAVAGYAAACGALCFSAVTKRQDTKRRTEPEYSPVNWFAPAVTFGGLVGLALLGVNAWHIATELAR